MEDYPMDKPRELKIIQWPESQRIMEHPEAALALGEASGAYMIPEDIWEKYKDSYYAKMWFQVQIDCKDPKDWEAAKKLRSKLTEEGITFDSGIGSDKQWDWSLDWSLSGCLPQYVFDQLTEHALDFTATEHEPEEE